VIPRVIHHVWPGRDAFRDPFPKWRQSWIERHPDWTLSFWRTSRPDGEPLGHALVDRVLADPAYSYVVRSDLLRWYLLAMHGGLYVDCDMECLRSFEPLLAATRASSNDCFFAPEPDHGVLSPALVGCSPHHPFAVMMFAAVAGSVEAAGPACNIDPTHKTGPYLMTEVLAEYQRHAAAAGASAAVAVNPAHWYCPRPGEVGKAYARHHFMGSNHNLGWRSRVGKPNLEDEIR
jgi:mannosyltransferase OCH1-like enzyme